MHAGAQKLVEGWPPCSTRPSSRSLGTTKPVRSLGVKNVDLGASAGPRGRCARSRSTLTGLDQHGGDDRRLVDASAPAPRRRRAGRRRRRRCPPARAPATHHRGRARRRTRPAAGRATPDPSRSTRHSEPRRPSPPACRHRLGRRVRSEPARARRPAVAVDRPVDAVDRVHAQLVRDELADERQRQLGRRVVAARRARTSSR